jgi:hypothetical protein
VAQTHQDRGTEQARPKLSSLIAPPHPTSVLIPTEKILYYERKHWAILIQPFLETLAALVLVTVMADQGNDTQIGPFTALIVLAAVVLAIRRYREREINRSLAYAIGIGLIVAAAYIGSQNLAIMAVLFVTGRFAFRFLKWAFYERLYITNRRVIGVEGFLGSEISTMPLTRVTDISYKTTVTAELLGYGILRVETAGQDQALGLINFLHKPEDFYPLLIDRTTAAVGSVTEEDTSDDDDPLDEDDGSGTREPQ